MACSGRALTCTVSDASGPGVPKTAWIMKLEPAGCSGVGNPGLFDRDRQPYWYRCDIGQLCVERPTECYPVRQTPDGFWLEVPGKGKSIVCSRR